MQADKRKKEDAPQEARQEIQALQEIELEPPATQKADLDAPATSGFVIKKRTEASRGAGPLCPLDVEKVLAEYPELNFLADLQEVRTPLLVFTENAERTIKKHVSWGKKTRENVNEQGGILIGRPFSLPDGGILGLVEHAIPAVPSRASSAYLEMGTETWVRMLDIYDTQYKDKGLSVIGWYHTHPNSLPVFMSFTDMGTQRTFFYQDWHFSAVMNPHRHLLACFCSKYAVSCSYYPQDYTARTWK